MHTPHNLGFAVIDELARRFALPWRRSFRFHARLANGRIDDHAVTLAKPNVFMNLSGAVVAALVRGRGFAAEDLLVIADDASLPAGRLRLRPRGRSGGHNGLQSVINQLGHDHFARLRLGSGPADNGAQRLREHVLTPFPLTVKAKMERMIVCAADAVVYLLKNGLAAAMNRFNMPNREELT